MASDINEREKGDAQPIKAEDSEQQLTDLDQARLELAEHIRRFLVMVEKGNFSEEYRQHLARSLEDLEIPPVAESPESVETSSDSDIPESLEAQKERKYREIDKKFPGKIPVRKIFKQYRIKEQPEEELHRVIRQLNGFEREMVWQMGEQYYLDPTFLGEFLDYFKPEGWVNIDQLRKNAGLPQLNRSPYAMGRKLSLAFPGKVRYWGHWNGGTEDAIVFVHPDIAEEAAKKLVELNKKNKHPYLVQQERTELESKGYMSFVALMNDLNLTKGGLLHYVKLLCHEGDVRFPGLRMHQISQKNCHMVYLSLSIQVKIRDAVTEQKLPDDYVFLYYQLRAHGISLPRSYPLDEILLKMDYENFEFLIRRNRNGNLVECAPAPMVDRIIAYLKSFESCNNFCQRCEIPTDEVYRCVVNKPMRHITINDNMYLHPETVCSLEANVAYIRQWENWPEISTLSDLLGMPDINLVELAHEYDGAHPGFIGFPAEFYTHTIGALQINPEMTNESVTYVEGLRKSYVKDLELCKETNLSLPELSLLMEMLKEDVTIRHLTFNDGTYYDPKTAEVTRGLISPQGWKNLRAMSAISGLSLDELLQIFNDSEGLEDRCEVYWNKHTHEVELYMSPEDSELFLLRILKPVPDDFIPTEKVMVELGFSEADFEIIINDYGIETVHFLDAEGGVVKCISETDQKRIISKQPPPSDWMTFEELADDLGVAIAVINRTAKQLEPKMPDMTRRYYSKQAGCLMVFLNPVLAHAIDLVLKK